MKENRKRTIVTNLSGLGVLLTLASMYNVTRIHSSHLFEHQNLYHLSVSDIIPKPPILYHWNWHPPRHERFPSIEKRVQIYMSSWYLPPCSNATKFKYRWKVLPNANGYSVLEVRRRERLKPTNFTSYLLSDRPVLLNRDVIMECLSFKGPTDWGNHVGRNKNLRFYTQDSLLLLDLVGNSTPVVAKYGDSQTDLELPIFVKWRWMANEASLKMAIGSTCGGATHLSTRRGTRGFPAPILWKLNQIRHWRPLQSTPKLDIPWEKKISMAVWRGAYTGKSLTNGVISNEEECLSNLRCRFVYDHAGSMLVNAGFTPKTNITKEFGVSVRKDRLTMEELLQYKIIISLEGNDVASGLKWQLLSQSVVMMPPPTRTSWAMEELLEPWVHYVPIHWNGSNTEERVQWVLEHDEEAQKIAERGSLFMYDMVFHPSASHEELAVMTEMARRYRELWY